LKFNDAGQRALLNYSAVNVGKRIAVVAQFPESRWLAAPKITRSITDGTLTFTPDADLDECRRIVDGLNLVVQEQKKQWMNR
jgi:hypothetical protein